VTVHVSWALLVVLLLLAFAAMQAVLAVIQAHFVRSVDRQLDGMCHPEARGNRARGESDQPPR